MKLKRRNKENRAKWLAATLEARGLTSYGIQSTLARKMGCSKSTAQNWCRGGVGNGELAIEFALRFDFSMADWIWENWTPDMIGPNAGQQEKEGLSRVMIEKRDKLTEAALKKTITFVAQHMNAENGEEFTDEWHSAFLTIFRILLKNEELGIDATEDLNSVAEVTKNAVLRR